MRDIFKYEQPQPYIVASTEYDDSYLTPVLTAGQSFILGYTNEENGIKKASQDNPVVIFDDFTTSSHYVDFSFKVKSSAMKLLSLLDKSDNIIFCFTALQKIDYVPVSHERHWISTFSKFEILCPSKKEQSVLGGIFKELDNLITLHQRKEIMDFSSENTKNLAQKLAFDWEQCKLGDSVEVCSGKDYKHLRSGDIPVYGTGGYMLSVNEALSYNQDAIGIGRKGTIDKPYVLNAPFWTVDTLFYAILKKNNDLSFMFSIFQKVDWKSKDESTGVPSLSKNTINDVDIIIPILEEQSKIGSIFSSIDNLITLHQRKYDKFVAIKKALLEKMFPRAGKSVPEIRFKGFTETWEQCELGKIGSTYTGLSGKSKADFGHGKGKFITYMNVFTNPIANLGTLEPIEIDDKQNTVSVGDVFFTTSSETPDEVGMSCVLTENSLNTYLNSFCFGYRPTSRFDNYYMAYMLRSASFRAKITFLAQGISRYNISKNKVMEIEIPIPEFDEQQKIGVYFKNIDNLITLHQRVLINF